jgi:hypothetical protein
MRLLATFLFLVISWAAFGQEDAASKWMHTDVTYTDARGNKLRILSSYPKGGAVYTDPSGKKYSYVIFGIHLFNESGSRAELTMKFPPGPYAIFPSPESHIKLFLPPDTLTVDKIPLLDYGLTNIPSMLDAGLGQPRVLHRVIPAKGESLFYVQVLFHQVSGTTRAALVLEGESLFFKISINPVIKDELIPCGQLVFRALR